MLTIFTSPKPFTGHSRVIQRNAIKSWALLRLAPQIILFGNEEGNAEVEARVRRQVLDLTARFPIYA